jgi:hypothetical protein
MKRLLAWSMVIALINVITLCPLLAAGMPASSSCCPHSKGPVLPCTESTGRNCPYVLLEKAKSERGLPAINLEMVAAIHVAELHPTDWFFARSVPSYFKDCSGSYLLHRVLRV